jgi:hypothetical protein
MRPRSGVHWTRVAVTTGADGRFRAKPTVDGPTYFVAQWTGHGSTAGAGSPAVLVGVTGR